MIFFHFVCLFMFVADNSKYFEMKNKINFNITGNLNTLSSGFSKISEYSKGIEQAFETQRNTMKDLTKEIGKANKESQQLAANLQKAAEKDFNARQVYEYAEAV